MLNNVLFMLLGAGLVTVGFIAAAHAERIRGARAMTRGQERQTPRPSIITIEPAEMPRTPTVTRIPTRTTTHEPAEMPRTPAVTRTPRPTRQATPSPGDDVVAALVAAGYKRAIAAEATWACDTAERATIENWTASALRRCGRGGLS